MPVVVIDDEETAGPPDCPKGCTCLTDCPCCNDTMVPCRNLCRSAYADGSHACCDICRQYMIDSISAADVAMFGGSDGYQVYDCPDDCTCAVDCACCNDGGLTCEEFCLNMPMDNGTACCRECGRYCRPEDYTTGGGGGGGELNSTGV